MNPISQSDLDLLTDHNAIERVHVAVDEAGGWYAVFYVKLLSGRTEAYRLLTQRKTPRTWADLRVLLRFLAKRYKVAEGTFSTTPPAN